MSTRARFWHAPLMAAALLASGCASSQMSRIDANRALYESWPLEMQQAVLDGRAEPGMTRDMVRMALGEPTEITGRSAGNNEDEIWIYRKGGDDGGGGNTGGMGMGSPGLSMGGTMGGVSVGTGGGGMRPTIGVGTGTGIDLGTGIGMGTPMPMRSSPVEEREVVFQDGVVLRADPAP